MQNLVIQLNGDIQRSNFEEWRTTFIARLQSIKTELQTDEDFGDAAQFAKELKTGENALRKAKASALDQSANIQRLFAAIDEVAELARQTRLTLERQIKQRKQELKDLAIDEGVAEIRKVIARQSLDFQQLDAARFIDRAHFISAIKGKAGIKGIETAIEQQRGQLQKAIEQKATIVADNAALLAGLPSEQQILFQDRGHLLDMKRERLAEEIDRRLTVYRDEQERKARSLTQTTTPESTPVQPPSPVPAASSTEPVAEFRLTVQLCCTKSEAQEIARRMREHLQGVDGVKGMRLTATPSADFEN